MPVRLLIAAAVLLPLMAACGGAAALNTTDVETQIGQGLSEQVGGRFDVICPADVPAEAGHTFTCEVDDRQGEAKVSVTVVEVDDQGSFTWKVSSPSPPA